MLEELNTAHTRTVNHGGREAVGIVCLDFTIGHLLDFLLARRV